MNHQASPPPLLAEALKGSRLACENDMAQAERARRHEVGPTLTAPVGRDDAAGAHEEMLARWSWRDFANMIFGAWLLAAPSTLGYEEPAMIWNDVISGSVIVVTSLLVLRPRFDLARWVLCAVGLWLLFAPLAFWTRDPSAYATDILIGALVITFSVLVPMMPGRSHHRVMMTPGPDVPPGWSYNPSDWIQRGPIIAMAFLGFLFSRYLAAYQVGHIPYPWDPFFDDGTRRVLDSDVSKAWPVSDAGLGAVSYMLEALSGFMGGRNRWRTMPWMVGLFGVLVVPVGVISLVLVILQPLVVGAWCTLCLVTAAAMLVMIAPAVDEVIATGQFLLGAKREGRPLWRTFWIGGALQEYGPSVSEPTSTAHRGGTASRIIAAMDLNAVPWWLVVSALVGTWLMASPSTLGATTNAAASNQLMGALVVTWSVIAFGAVARSVRLLNIPLGLWIMVTPWFMNGDSALFQWHNIVAGITIVACSLRRGAITERFGGWNRYLI